jgi:hypothetical protein
LLPLLANKLKLCNKELLLLLLLLLLLGPVAAEVAAAVGVSTDSSEPGRC